MEHFGEEFLWSQKYRPRTVADCILPENLKAIFQGYVDQKNIPNMILAGSAGVGKTTVARAMLDEMGCDYIVINGSLDRNIDTLRNEISQFASSVSFSGGRKYVIIDEADGLSPTSFQPALRSFIEQYSSNCGFILTCNFKKKIIAPLHSRCPVIDFKITKKEKPLLAAAFMKRTYGILRENNVSFDKDMIAELILTFFPDWRRVLNELQKAASTGAIDNSIFASINASNFDPLFEALKARNFKQIRQWVGENSDIEPSVLFRTFYETATDRIVPASIPSLILTIADYQHRAAFVADNEINTVAFLLEVARDCEIK
jgi:DNA polymerase III delta prime subunit